MSLDECRHRGAKSRVPGGALAFQESQSSLGQLLRPWKLVLSVAHISLIRTKVVSINGINNHA